MPSLNDMVTAVANERRIEELVLATADGQVSAAALPAAEDELASLRAQQKALADALSPTGRTLPRPPPPAQQHLGASRAR